MHRCILAFNPVGALHPNQLSILENTPKPASRDQRSNNIADKAEDNSEKFVSSCSPNRCYKEDRQVLMTV